jgi:transmembrane 9 superfamily protein 3
MSASRVRVCVHAYPLLRTPDELPIWGMVGELSNTEEAHHIHPIAAKVQWSSAVAMARDAAPAYLYTHKSFSIAYNGDQIVQVNLTSEVPKPIRKGEVYAMTYSVKWVATSAPFAKRFDIYLDTNFFEHQIHWFSIFNSFMMVIFLCGLVALILMRTLRNDYQKYSAETDELDLDRVIDESGWKQVRECD